MGIIFHRCQQRPAVAVDASSVRLFPPNHLDRHGIYLWREADLAMSQRWSGRFDCDESHCDCRG